MAPPEDLLKPTNPDFPAIDLSTDDEGSVRVVAEFVDVLS
jgi:SOS-response transcriptional repressor LexA